MNTLEILHNLFSEHLEGAYLVFDNEPVEAKDPGFDHYSTSFIPTVLPEELREQYFVMAVISITELLKQEKTGPIYLRPLKDVKYSRDYVNLDINDKGVWTISLMVEKDS